MLHWLLTSFALLLLPHEPIKQEKKSECNLTNETKVIAFFVQTIQVLDFPLFSLTPLMHKLVFLTVLTIEHQNQQFWVVKSGKKILYLLLKPNDPQCHAKTPAGSLISTQGKSIIFTCLALPPNIWMLSPSLAYFQPSSGALVAKLSARDGLLTDYLTLLGSSGEEASPVLLNEHKKLILFRALFVFSVARDCHHCRKEK